ncbi:MAG: CPBP family intramembrane metalloprotease [Thermoplasmatales archaeon]|nr:CPBP family intramembrane metalloprotease [Thermoplasmatales archaeon]
MEWIKRSLIGADFLLFFIAGFLFILFNSEFANYISIAAGIFSIPLSMVFFRNEVHQDFKTSMVQFSIFVSAFLLLIIFYYITDPSWAKFLPIILLTPVIIEEFNFRYLIQRLLFRNMSPYAALFLQALIYMAYYSKYAIADHGAAYPFPFNLLLLTSVLGMGMVYGVITKFSKNFLPAATLHFVIWALFPLLAHYPGIATTLLPT